MISYIKGLQEGYDQELFKLHSSRDKGKDYRGLWGYEMDVCKTDGTRAATSKDGGG
jgi:hypothetical protein